MTLQPTHSNLFSDLRCFSPIPDEDEFDRRPSSDYEYAQKTSCLLKDRKISEPKTQAQIIEDIIKDNKGETQSEREEAPLTQQKVSVMESSTDKQEEESEEAKKLDSYRQAYVKAL